MTRENAPPESSNDDEAIDGLVELSRVYGRDRSMVLAGGGNTSVKAGGALWIKASGRALATIERDGFVAMDRRRLEALSTADLGADPETREARFKEAILAARIDPGGARPSVECVLHHLVPARFVVHTHPTRVNALMCCDRGEELAREWFGEAVLWMPYVDPGVTLARALRRKLEEHRAVTGRDVFEAILLANHGLVVGGERPEDVRRRTAAVIERVAAEIAAAAGPGRGGGAFGEETLAEDARPRGEVVRGALEEALGAAGGPVAVLFDDSAVVRSLVGAAAGREIASAGPLTPDQIVYANSVPLWLDLERHEDGTALRERLRARVEEHARRTRFLPKIVLVAGVGLLAVGRDRATAGHARDLYVDAIEIMAGARRLGGIRALTERERRFIEEWEVEAYRRQVRS